MRNAFRIVLVIGAIVIVAALGLTAFASGSSPTLSPTPTSMMSSSDDGPFDISGNCDEPEHFNDPECQGVTPGLRRSRPLPSISRSRSPLEPDEEVWEVAQRAAQVAVGDLEERWSFLA